ncbi:uncharacterized protein LOC122050392 [Zingiber officinale]|uniref:uncharacterized protein LOC122050392 n=1 Tax=Zingiber officinale TaxID=94328 RepID=UPI001C4BC922|nr:uncharacterized protein LOC122050392 [Zingiber officinale]
MDVVTTIRIEAPKVSNASLLLYSLADPLDALMNLFEASFPSRTAALLLNYRKIPNILLAARNGNPVKSAFKLDFNLEDQSSTTIFTELLKKCNDCNTKFDIHVNPTRIESSTEATKDDQHLFYGSTGLELINLQIKMPKSIFEGFLSNQKKMEKFKDIGLEMLRRRTNKEQFMDILASQESLFKVSNNCFEMKI